LINSIHYIAITQGIITGIVLLFLKRNEKREFKYLALFLILLSLAIINESYGDYLDSEFHVLYPFKFFLLLPNLIFLHVNSKVIGENSNKTVLINILPGSIEFVILCGLLILSKLNMIDSDSEFFFYFDDLYNYLTIIYTIIIQIIILKKIRHYNRNLFAFKSTIHYKYLNWLKWVCIIIIVNEIYYTLFYLFTNDPDTDNKIYAVYAIIELVLIFYISIGSLLQVNMDIDIPVIDSIIKNIEVINPEKTNQNDSVF